MYWLAATRTALLRETHWNVAAKVSRAADSDNGAEVSEKGFSIAGPELPYRCG
jgi:hypothetical protein